MYRNILIPSDGSPLAQAGVSHGLSLAKALGAKVTAVVVSEPFFGAVLPGEIEPAFSIPTSEIAAASRAAAQKVLAAIHEEAAALGVACSEVHVFDRFPPAEGILDTARNEACDLIVMASHGRRGIRRALLGSQALEVVTRADVPVLVVR